MFFLYRRFIVVRRYDGCAVYVEEYVPPADVPAADVAPPAPSKPVLPPLGSTTYTPPGSGTATAPASVVPGPASTTDSPFNVFGSRFSNVLDLEPHPSLLGASGRLLPTPAPGSTPGSTPAAAAATAAPAAAPTSGAAPAPPPSGGVTAVVATAVAGALGEAAAPADSVPPPGAVVAVPPPLPAARVMQPRPRIPEKLSAANSRAVARLERKAKEIVLSFNRLGSEAFTESVHVGGSWGVHLVCGREGGVPCPLPHLQHRMRSSRFPAPMGARGRLFGGVCRVSPCSCGLSDVVVAWSVCVCVCACGCMCACVGCTGLGGRPPQHRLRAYRPVLAQA